MLDLSKAETTPQYEFIGPDGQKQSVPLLDTWISIVNATVSANLLGTDGHDAIRKALGFPTLAESVSSPEKPTLTANQCMLLYNDMNEQADDLDAIKKVRARLLKSSTSTASPLPK